MVTTNPKLDKQFVMLAPSGLGWPQVAPKPRDSSPLLVPVPRLRKNLYFWPQLDQGGPNWHQSQGADNLDCWPQLAQGGPVSCWPLAPAGSWM